MHAFFESGRFVDVALIAIVVEMALLLVLRRGKAHGLRPLDLVGQLLSGAILLLALRCVVTGVDYRITLLLLTASFPAHLYDLVRRARAA